MNTYIVIRIEDSSDVLRQIAIQNCLNVVSMVNYREK